MFSEIGIIVTLIVLLGFLVYYLMTWHRDGFSMSSLSNYWSSFQLKGFGFDNKSEPLIAEVGQEIERCVKVTCPPANCPQLSCPPPVPCPVCLPPVQCPPCPPCVIPNQPPLTIPPPPVMTPPPTPMVVPPPVMQPPPPVMPQLPPTPTVPSSNGMPPESRRCCPKNVCCRLSQKNCGCRLRK